MNDKLAEAATSLAKVRAQIAKAELKIAPLKKAADELEDLLRTAMIEGNIDTISTKDTTFSLQRTQIALLDDANEFFEYVRKHRAYDLLRRQPVIEACRVRWEDGLKIPGVHADTRVSLRATARKGKSK